MIIILMMVMMMMVRRGRRRRIPAGVIHRESPSDDSNKTITLS
jgi:hypothetical protein